MSKSLASDLSKVEPALAWQPWIPDEQQPWNRVWAAHLYRRAGFGASSSEIERALTDGFVPTLRRLLEGTPESAERFALLDEIGQGFASNEATPSLRGWWLYAMLQSGHPLREKLTLFWHNHFATSIAKVKLNALMYRQNRIFRSHALGRFGPFLQEVSHDPAMLIWLDANQNLKKHPNENFAREVMELFTLGVGNYTEKDVQAAARSFTGWQTDPAGAKLVFNAAEHDSEPKTVLGAQGNWDGDDILKLLLRQPAASRFLVGKIYRDFVSETEPPAELLAPLAERFRKSDYDIADLMKTILGSRLFFSEHALYRRVKSPVELVLGAVRAAWPGSVPPSELVPHLERMGQQLFEPPNVKGWVGGKVWLNNATLLARNNFCEAVAMGQFTSGPSQPRNRGLGAVVMTSVGAERLFSLDARPQPVQVPKNFDMVQQFDLLKIVTSTAIVERLGEIFLPGRLPDRAKSKLAAFLAEGKPTGGELAVRIREAAHAMMCMPEYQLC